MMLARFVCDDAGQVSMLITIKSTVTGSPASLILVGKGNKEGRVNGRPLWIVKTTRDGKACSVCYESMLCPTVMLATHYLPVVSTYQ